MLLQKKGIYAKNVLIVNVHNEGLTNLCTSKIESLNPDIDFFQKSDLVREAVLEHEVYIFYKVEIWEKWKDFTKTTNKLIFQEAKKKNTSLKSSRYKYFNEESI